VLKVPMTRSVSNFSHGSGMISLEGVKVGSMIVNGFGPKSVDSNRSLYPISGGTYTASCSSHTI
jgi:hypothetical protein